MDAAFAVMFYGYGANSGCSTNSDAGTAGIGAGRPIVGHHVAGRGIGTARRLIACSSIPAQLNAGGK